MLDRRENEVMGAVFALCAESGRCLVAPADLLRLLPERGRRYDGDKLEKILRALELDGYFECLSSDRQGEKMYVIVLRAKGSSYRRSRAQTKRDFFLRFVWTIFSAVVAFLVGVCLKRIFQ